MNLLAILEGLLFVVGDEGLSLEQAETILEVDRSKLAELIDDLQTEYEKDSRGIKMEVLGNYLKLVTKPIHKEYYQKLIDNEESSYLSQSALETLAIIAYNEPVTRMNIENIRGVDSSHMVRKLLSRNFIKELGRSDLPGRPMLFGITSTFLDYFGLASIAELPKIMQEESEPMETDLFKSKYKES